MSINNECSTTWFLHMQLQALNGSATRQMRLSSTGLPSFINYTYKCKLGVLGQICHPGTTWRRWLVGNQ